MMRQATSRFQRLAVYRADAVCCVETFADASHALTRGFSSEPSTSQGTGNKLRRIGPAARRLLSESGLSEKEVSPTGPYGTITKEDVQAALDKGQMPERQQQGQQESKPPPPKTSGGQAASPSQQDVTLGRDERHQDNPNSQIRKIIAQRLLESKQTVPHFYSMASADLEAVTQLRQTMKSQGLKISVNDFVIRAVALALSEVPQANSAWDPAAEEAVPAESVDVAIAVATDKGLITPIIKAASTKSLKQIAEEVRELAGKARANKLRPEEFQGGTFTVSNLGMFGVDYFSAIINPPQAGILAVGGTQQNVSLAAGQPVVRAGMNMTLSADQRVFDGATTAKFLAAICSNLANPVKLLG